MKFPDDWPVFAAKDKIGDWLEHYTRIMELNYWSSTECTNARWDEDAREWEVSVMRDGEPVTLRPKQLVFALGVSGYPKRSQVRRRRDVPGGAVPLVQAPGRWRLDGQESRSDRLQQLGTRHLRRLLGTRR
jgi:cation diffusion facilitator CzcD-associated flavoprotein CzcO